MQVVQALPIVTVRYRLRAWREAVTGARTSCERLRSADEEGPEDEEAEYEMASKLLVPSEHVRSTFLERGFAPEKLIRHQYGFDPQTFRPGPDRVDRPADDERG